MGWDMYAVRPNGGKVDDLSKFKEASDEVARVAGSVDGDLAEGGLDCSPCARAMEAMTGESAWSDWTAEEMAERFAKAAIPDGVPEENRWGFYSAYAFMKICAEMGLGANASY